MLRLYSGKQQSVSFTIWLVSVKLQPCPCRKLMHMVQPCSSLYSQKFDTLRSSKSFTAAFNLLSKKISHEELLSIQKINESVMGPNHMFKEDAVANSIPTRQHLCEPMNFHAIKIIFSSLYPVSFLFTLIKSIKNVLLTFQKFIYFLAHKIDCLLWRLNTTMHSLF